MIAAEDCALVLLAAGRSQRFGAGSKLEQDLLGQPVGLHAAETLTAIPFRARIAVTGTARIDYAAHGYTVAHNPDAASGMASSIRLGVAAAIDHRVTAVVIALADMPRVTPAHVRRLLESADADHGIVVSSDGTCAMPPAVFTAAHFDALLTLKGDRGARELIKVGRRIVTSPAELIDIDTADDLARLRAAYS